MFEYFAALLGLVATVWITCGVYIAGRFYPNYDHFNQFCSELGAAGSPTQKLSPWLNNYPLSVMFVIFGWHVTQLPEASIAFYITGVLIVFHGIGTWFAGYFPMDKDPYTPTPSRHCLIHSTAGSVVMLTLLLAPVFVAISPDSELVTPWFRVFSILIVLISMFFTAKLVNAFQVKRGAGLYQRLSYWTQLIWLSVFSLVLM
ncbi:DUF998 domain-containing protein [Pseudoalteromonas rubra]|uniref:DUF998 domain-containing protein n=1 Tax=Pseudoalteromonas rubra TaxID=43658 RepID=A0A0U2P5G2_9GAMM|nr:DUF998 domain-containing protein [Pseudoalteromonas rubra]ALU42317.1 hypothetical protein AT705_04775 [Pseudoalteromonas rubra]